MFHVEQSNNDKIHKIMAMSKKMMLEQADFISMNLEILIEKLNLVHIIVEQCNEMEVKEICTKSGAAWDTIKKNVDAAAAASYNAGKMDNDLSFAKALNSAYYIKNTQRFYQDLFHVEQTKLCHQLKMQVNLLECFMYCLNNLPKTLKKDNELIVAEDFCLLGKNLYTELQTVKEIIQSAEIMIKLIVEHKKGKF